MKKTFSVLALFIVLLFSVWQENPLLDTPEKTELGKTDNTTGQSEQSDVPATQPVQEIKDSMEPFDIAVFNTQKAVWEAEHPSQYSFYQ
jgi:hypothetical protein